MKNVTVLPVVGFEGTYTIDSELTLRNAKGKAMASKNGKARVSKDGAKQTLILQEVYDSALAVSQTQDIPAEVEPPVKEEKASKSAKKEKVAKVKKEHVATETNPFQGVHWNIGGNAFRSQIYIQRTFIFLKQSKDPSICKMYYDKANELREEFAGDKVAFKAMLNDKVGTPAPEETPEEETSTED